MTIGLFGTCGDSQWRVPFMKKFDDLGINYFNPVKDDWEEEDAKIEAEHLVGDDIVLFPVTDETIGLGSLGEVGFSILQAIRLDSNRSVVVMINDSVNDNAKEVSGEALVKESIKMRALIKAHLKKIKYTNVYIVDNMDDMLVVTLKLHNIKNIEDSIKKYTH